MRHGLAAKKRLSARIMTDKITGSCYCGDFTYESTAELIGSHYCYCTACQAFHGGPFGAGFALLDDHTSIEGDLAEYVIRTDSGNDRTILSCKTCSCPVATRVSAFSGVTMFSAATLKDQSLFKPEVHLWVRSKPAWHEIGDDLPQYETQPDF